MSLGITGTPDQPAGRVRIDVTGLSAGSQAVTVHRISYRPHRSRLSARLYEESDVRGWSGTTWTGSTLTLLDYEFDPGDGSAYWYSLYTVTSTAVTGSASATCRPQLAEWWIKSIQSPGNSVVARSAISADIAAPSGVSSIPLLVSALSSSKRAARRGVFPIVGSALPVVVTDVHTASELTLTVVADDDDAMGRVEDLVCAGDVLFIQPPAELDAPGPIWAVAGDWERDRIGAASSDRVATIPLIQVAPPPPSVSSLSWTYADVRIGSATYATVASEYASYADLAIGPAPGTFS